MAVKKQSRSKSKPRVGRSVVHGKPSVRSRSVVTTKRVVTTKTAVTTKPAAPAEPAAAPQPVEAATQAETRWWTGAPAILGAALCVLVALSFVGSPSASRIDDVTPDADFAPELAASVEPARKAAAHPKPAAKPAPAAPLTTGPAPKPAPPAASTEKSAHDAEPESAPAHVALVPPAVTPALPSAVTITGCLERSDDTYRLSDTTGVAAPTSRSWKTGFLTKRPASIEVLDPARQLNLSGHVGQRVSVTGTLEDREMRGRSLQRVASSCESKPTAKI
jgi:hypothetical protein